MARLELDRGEWDHRRQYCDKDREACVTVCSVELQEPVLTAGESRALFPLKPLALPRDDCPAYVFPPSCILGLSGPLTCQEPVGREPVGGAKRRPLPSPLLRGAGAWECSRSLCAQAGGEVRPLVNETSPGSLRKGTALVPHAEPGPGGPVAGTETQPLLSRGARARQKTLPSDSVAEGEAHEGRKRGPP